MKPCPRRKAARVEGFTIVEVMMAVVIMAFAFTTSITTMQRGFLAVESARNLTVASQIMQSEFEKMRLKDWATVSGYAAGPTSLTIDSVFTANAAIGNRFTLTRITSTPATDMVMVTLTVTWSSIDGRTLSRSLSTYYGRYGLYDYFYNNS